MNNLYPERGIAAYKLKLFQMDTLDIVKELTTSYIPQYYKDAAKKELDYRHLEDMWNQEQYEKAILFDIDRN